MIQTLYFKKGIKFNKLGHQTKKMCFELDSFNIEQNRVKNNQIVVKCRRLEVS